MVASIPDRRTGDHDGSAARHDNSSGRGMCDGIGRGHLKYHPDRHSNAVRQAFETMTANRTTAK
jgi:hypothetical protein